jgi:sortase A
MTHHTTVTQRAPRSPGARGLALGAVLAVALVVAGCGSAPAPRAPTATHQDVPDVVPVAAPREVSAPLLDTAVPPSLATSWLSIPSIGVHDLRVVAYTGSPDDAPGTVIEDRGVAASPRGSLGGGTPGSTGNFIVTGHRTAAGAPLGRLPELQVGAHVLVRAGSWVYDYVVTATMSVSFRSVASKALQTAAVPGHPGQVATRPMITLSTCATPEDHAAGDWWHDALGNPEHRIDKVGVLVDVRPV